MIKLNNFQIGDVLQFKKEHPCGGNTWKVLRTGVDMKLECTTCQRVIMIPRLEVNKRLKKLIGNPKSSQ